MKLRKMLNDKIKRLEALGSKRSETIKRMAAAADLDANTVNEILDGTINCPPLKRLRGFAKSLNLTLTEIQSAAEKDGCKYGQDS